MNQEIMRSDEVPGKFTEWLLSMGCPADRVPSQDKISEVCRGQYHMVWQSMMEKVEAREVVRQKRMQVFCDDIRRCLKNNVFTQQDSSTIVPEQLSLWKQQSDLKKKVEDAKARVMLARRDLDQLMDKVSTKLAQRELARTREADLSRRVWLLRQVADDLAAKKTDLQETRAIADSLCAHDDDDSDIQAKLDKCLAAFRHQTNAQVSPSTSNASVTSNDNDLEEQVLQLVKSKGGDLCGALYERRSVLVQALAKYGGSPKTCNNIVSAQSVSAHTAALHCTLQLEAIKNNIHLRQTLKKLIATITDLGNYLSPEARELLVVRCEKTNTAARVHSLRASLDDCNSDSGVFYTSQDGNIPTTHGKHIHAITKDIESKKEELRRITDCMVTTERKIQSVRDCLQLVFSAFRTEAPHTQPLHYRGIQLDLPSESIPSVREWYSRQRESHRRRVDLSMELEVSDASITDTDYNNLRFVDELRIYLKKFNLENNRQLVLESGEKLWIFETIQSSIHRLYSAWCSNNVPCSLLCPSHGVAMSASRIADILQTRAELEETLNSMSPHRGVQIIDITFEKEEEQQITDRTKKRLRENLLELEKMNKIIVLAEENLKLWSNNGIRKYISPLRKHDGITYRDYELDYMENCLLLCPRK